MVKKQTNESQTNEVEAELPKDAGLALMPSHDTVQQLLREEKRTNLQEEVEKEGKLGKEAFDAANKSPEMEEDDGEKSPQHTGLELEALDRGWVPQEEFKGIPDRWIPADQFIDRMNMMEKIGDLKSDLREQKHTNEQMLKMFEKVASREAKKEAEDLLRRKRDAILEGNVEDVEKYEKEYQERRSEIEGFKDLNPKMEYDSRISEDVRGFISRNKSWYNEDTETNREMFNFARRIDAEFLNEPYYRAMPEIKRLEEVEKSVKRHFSDRFENPNRKRAPAVEGRGQPIRKDSSKVLYKDLPDEYKKIVDSFIKSGVKMTRDEYTHQLFNTGAISHG